jgi:hypothetical protein
LGLLNERPEKDMSWPTWIFELPSASQSPSILEQRLDWINARADRLADIGCEIGRQKTDDSLFCSVE